MRGCCKAAGLLLSGTGELLAHPGHGTTPPASPQHYVLEPLHAVPVLILAALLAVAVIWWRRSRAR